MSRLAAALARDRSGASALITGLSLVAVLGFAGLGLDAGSWYNLRRTAQHAADSAAFSGATAMGAGDDAAGQARAVAAVYGIQDGLNGAGVTVNTPPVSGAYKGDAAAVEVIVARPAPRFLSGLFLKASPVIRARAVGRAGAAADACVVAFNTLAAGSLQIGGQPDVKLNGCSAYINSSNSSALSMNGGATLTASSVQLVGGYSTSGQATINAANGVTTGVKPLSDPYADVAIPAYQSLACTYANAISSGSVRFAPDPGGNIRRFCGDVTINSGVTVTFDPGIYVIDRGRFTVNGGAVVRGAGVTIVLTSSTGSGYSTVTINGGADIQLSAPTSGPTAGLLFFQDRKAPSDTNTINGGSTAVFGGALYFPKQFVRFNGGTDAGPGGCTQLLADTIEFNGNARFDINCEGTGVRLGAGGKTQLVE